MDEDKETGKDDWAASLENLLSAAQAQTQAKGTMHLMGQMLGAFYQGLKDSGLDDTQVNLQCLNWLMIIMQAKK